MESTSAAQIYNCDFIHKLLIIQWNQGCHVVAEVTLDKNWTPYVIYTSYINIFQRGKVACCLFGQNSIHKWVAHIHCKPLKRIHKSSPETLVYFFIGGTMREKAWSHERTKITPELEKTFQMDYNKERVYTENKYRTTYTVWKDLLHSCIVYMRKLFGSTTLIGWTVISMYSSGPHRQKWQTYFKMIFSLTAWW